MFVYVFEHFSVYYIITIIYFGIQQVNNTYGWDGFEQNNNNKNKCKQNKLKITTNIYLNNKKKEFKLCLYWYRL